MGARVYTIRVLKVKANRKSQEKKFEKLKKSA